MAIILATILLLPKRVAWLDIALLAHLFRELTHGIHTIAIVKFIEIAIWQSL